jgi:hypothetical protein
MAAPVPLGEGVETDTGGWQAATVITAMTTATAREGLDIISGSVWVRIWRKRKELSLVL